MPADDKGPAPRSRDTIGDLLRRTRLEHGAELESVAATLRIRAPYIAAIEQGRFDRLPGPVYALGFVRTYALYLGLDGDEAVRRFKLEAAGLEQRRDLAFPLPLTPRSVPGGRMLLAAFVLAVCAYGIWHYLSTGDRARPERVAAVPTDLMPPPTPPPPAAPAPAPAATAGPAPGAAATVSGAPPSGDGAAAPTPGDQTAAAGEGPPPVTPAPAPVPVAATPLPPPASTGSPVAPPPTAPGIGATALATGTPPAPPSPAPPGQMPPGVADQPPPAAANAGAAAPHVYGAVGGPSRITLRAIKDCWIQVRDSDAADTVVAQRTLRAGDSYRVPDRAGLVLRTGNATGLAISVDDKAAPALGGTVRNVALDPAQLLAGTARQE